MPGFIPTNTVVKVDASGRLFGQVLDNTFWFRNRSSAPDVPAMLSLGSQFNTWFATNIVSQLSHDYGYLGCVVTSQESDIAPAVNVPVTAILGTIAEDSMPGGTCLCFGFKTAGRGRSSAGRNYVSGIPVPYVLANAVDAVYAEGLRSNYASLLTDTISTDWAWSVVSHYTAGAPRAAGLPQDIISVTLADLFVDSQRRRLTGRGT